MKNFKEYLTELNKSPVDRKKVFILINKHKKELLNKKIKISQLVKILDSIHNKLNLEVEINTFKTPSLGQDVLAVSGNYDPQEDEWGGVSVFINLIYSNDPFEFDEINWNSFVKEYPASLEHEYLHAAQYRKRDFEDQRLSKETDKTKKYLSNPDEIEAFASDISHELKSKMSVSKAKKVLKNLKNAVKYSSRLKDYVDVFQSNDKVMKSLIKKVLIYLES